MAVSVIAMLGFVVVTECISCYTDCADQIVYTSEDEIVTGTCNNTAKKACPDGMDICTTTYLNVTANYTGILIVGFQKVDRSCGISSVQETSDQKTICGTLEEDTKADVKKNFGYVVHFDCQVDTCSSDFCNTHHGIGDELFADPEPDDDHDDDPYRFVSSGSRLKVEVTFLVTALIAVAIVHV